MGKRIIIGIAHRLGTILTSDQISGLEKEQGTHDKLIKLNGYYAHMNEIQKMDE